MALLKSTFKRWNGSSWDIHYFRTSADVIDETTSYKVMTADERAAIANYLNTFNAANKLLKLDGSGKIPVGLIPGGLDYLKTNNPAFTGTMSGKLYEGVWEPDSTLLKIGSHSAAASGSGQPGYIEFVAGQGDYVSAEVSASEIRLLSAIGIDVGNQVIKNVGDPTSAHHAANKGYVDGLIATGTRPIDPVKAATTGPITLSGLQSIDDYTVAAGDRVLVKDQGTASENGIYTASASGWSKITADSAQGRLTFVEHGAVNNDTQFYATTNTSWSLFSRVDTITAGSGLSKNGTTISVAPLGITNSMLAGSISYNKLVTTSINDNLSLWTNPSFGTAGSSNTLTVWLQSALSAIKNLRGTASYKTDNNQTIAGAYDLVEAKNRTYVGSDDPATTGFVSGDIYLQDIPQIP